MSEGEQSAGRGRGGCLGTSLMLLAGVLGLIVLVAGTMSIVALLQSRGMTAEPQRFERELPQSSSDDADRPGVLQLRVVSARVVLSPTAAGEPIGVEAEFDPRYYALEQRQRELDDGRWLFRVRFAPTGNHVMAMLRMKLGTALPTLRISLPRDVAFELDGDVRAGFAALELGGTALRELDLFVGGGAGTVSFLEPLQRPMGRLVVVGDKGSVEVTGMGNASPAEAIVEHRLGEIDVDLRGAWRRDASIRLDVSLGGGGVWLPDNAVLEGLPGGHDRSRPRGDAPSDELASPRLRFDVSQGAGRLVFID